MTDTNTEQTKSSQRLMGDILGDLAQVRSAKTLVKVSMNQIEKREESLRDELAFGMSAAGIKTGTGSGLTATLKTRKGAAVIDQAALVEALDKRGELPNFLKLDTFKAAKHGATHGLPGAAFEDTTYLSVGEAK